MNTNPLNILSNVIAAMLLCIGCSTNPEPTVRSPYTSIFDGETFAGWEGNLDSFRIEDGAIVGGSLDDRVPRNEFLATTQVYEDFELTVTFKLLGEDAKRTMVYSQEEVYRFNHEFLDSGHILLGIIKSADGRAGREMRRAGVDLGNARSTFLRIVGEGPDLVTIKPLELTSQARDVLNEAVQLAETQHRGLATNEDLLFVLLEDATDVPAQTLIDLGIDPREIQTGLKANAG